MFYRHSTWIQRKNTGQGMLLHTVKLGRNSFTLLDGGKEA